MPIGTFRARSNRGFGKNTQGGRGGRPQVLLSLFGGKPCLSKPKKRRRQHGCLICDNVDACVVEFSLLQVHMAQAGPVRIGEGGCGKSHGTLGAFASTRCATRHRRHAEFNAPPIVIPIECDYQTLGIQVPSHKVLGPSKPT